jgi:hypothetical protein
VLFPGKYCKFYLGKHYVISFWGNVENALYIECLLWCLVSEEILLMLYRNNSVVIPFPGEYCYCYITRSTAVLSHFPGIFFYATSILSVQVLPQCPVSEKYCYCCIGVLLWCSVSGEMLLMLNRVTAVVYHFLENIVNDVLGYCSDVSFPGKYG